MEMTKGALEARLKAEAAAADALGGACVRFLMEMAEKPGMLETLGKAVFDKKAPVEEIKKEMLSLAPGGGRTRYYMSDSEAEACVKKVLGITEKARTAAAEPINFLDLL